MLLLVSLYLGLVILLPLTLSAAVSYRTLPRGRGCPLCHSETFLMQAVPLDVLNRACRQDVLQRRWCVFCGWEGLARGAAAVELTPAPVQEPPVRASTLPPELTEPEAADPVAALSVRRLEVDGRPWRVLLQLWPASQRWRGRLLFVGPAGQRCADNIQALDGGSPDDLLGQARAVPERTLAGRVRDLMITD